MIIYGKVDPPSIANAEALLLVQEAQFEKFHHELVTPSISMNVAQRPKGHEFNFLNFSQFSNNRGGAYSDI